MKKILLLSSLFILLTIGCEKEEIDNELVGTQWEQVKYYRQSGMQYYPDGNWWGQVTTLTEDDIKIMFLDNHNGKMWIKVQITTRSYERTDTQVDLDETLDFTYNYDSNKKRGELTFIYDGNGLIELDHNHIYNKEENFGLFFDSDDLWFGDKTNNFVLSK